jgi:trehalose 6-phosphate phosphatase
VAWLHDPATAGVMLDFDGTLASIVAKPDMARPVPGALEVLDRLARRYRVVAIISGRPAWFLAAHVPIAIDRWGGYGLEHVMPTGEIVIDPAARGWEPEVAGVVARALAAAPEGVGVEDKGTSVTLHVREAPQHADWLRDFVEREAERTGLAVYDAKKSIELRPPLQIDKGTVVSRVVADAGLTAACFVGDDHGDLSAFRALDDVPSALRVAVRSEEAPADLLAAADLIVDGQEGVLEFLRGLGRAR